MSWLATHLSIDQSWLFAYLLAQHLGDGNNSFKHSHQESWQIWPCNSLVDWYSWQCNTIVLLCNSKFPSFSASLSLLAILLAFASAFLEEQVRIACPTSSQTNQIANCYRPYPVEFDFVRVEFRLHVSLTFHLRAIVTCTTLKISPMIRMERNRFLQNSPLLSIFIILSILSLSLSIYLSIFLSLFFFESKKV